MIKLYDVSLSYGDKLILDKLSFCFEAGKKYALMGESGIGKSTLLGIVSGLLKPNKGTVEVDSKKISYAFQDDRLFPWLTVVENVILVSNMPKDEAKIRASQILCELGLSDALNMYPDELSGGMRQRVSIARALMYDGEILCKEVRMRNVNRKWNRHYTLFCSLRTTLLRSNGYRIIRI